MKEAKIALASLRFSSNRAYGGEGEINILAEDIKLNGLINPITVMPAKYEGCPPREIYDVVAGRRRIMAVTKLGWKEIPCRILEGDEIVRAEEIAGAENINRLSMHPLDEAAIFQKLLEHGEAIGDLAKRFDRKASDIWQRIQLIELNEDVKTLFRNGHLTLQSAAMVRSLSTDAQKAFYKEFKTHWQIKDGGVIEDRFIKAFISRLDHDKLYGFLRDKQCAECKTRTFFTDKNLFPEMDDVSENCFNHGCYLQKWEKVLAGRIKSVKGEHKSHAGATLIVASYNFEEFQKIVGKKTTIDGTEYEVLPYNWATNANAKDKGAVPCISIDISHGKLQVVRGYWKKAERETSGSGISNTEKKKKLSPVVELLDLPKAEKDQALQAMTDSKRITPYGLNDNVRSSVFWQIIDLKAQEFKDLKAINKGYKEMFLKKFFHYLAGADKKIFEKFVEKMSIPDLAKIDSDKIFGLLLAMEWNPYDMPNPEDFAKGKQNDILKWVGLDTNKLKQLYQEEISKRIPKQKPEKKPADAKPKPKTPTAKKPTPVKGKKPIAKMSSAKKTPPAKGAVKK